MAGLGLPFLVFVLLLTIRDATGIQAPRQNSLIPDTTLLRVPLRIPGLAQPDSVAPEPPPLATAKDQFNKVSFTIRRGDTLDGLFSKHRLSRRDLAMIMRLPEARQHLRLLRPGDRIIVRYEESEIVALERAVDETRTLLVRRQNEGFAAELLENPVERRLAHAHGIIDSSLFEAATAAGISDKVTMKLAGIFAWDVDFVLDIRGGDEFLVVYEQIWQDGQYLRDGEIVAAEFTNNGRNYRAVRFPASDPGDYYTPQGLSVRKAFLRAPVDFSRISSNFNLRRLHPIFKSRRPHRGVDYAAPAGTAIKAAGDGKVLFRGRKDGYGNTVILQHGGNITTLYAHMSRFARNAAHGRRVKQGQVIGFVGQTGYATGPHLHYEYRLNGTHRNPRTVKLPKAAPIEARYRQEFLSHADSLLAQLDLLRRTQLVSAAPAARE